jgi:hypothetical protein
VLVHGDFHGDNQVWDRDELRLVMDFATAGAAEPEYELRTLPGPGLGPGLELLTAVLKVPASLGGQRVRPPLLAAKRERQDGRVELPCFAPLDLEDEDPFDVVMQVKTLCLRRGQEGARHNRPTQLVAEPAAEGGDRTGIPVDSLNDKGGATSQLFPSNLPSEGARRARVRLHSMPPGNALHHAHARRESEQEHRNFCVPIAAGGR